LLNAGFGCNIKFEKQLLNFTAFSGPDIGGWIFFTAALLIIGTLGFEIYKSKIGRKTASMAIAVFICVSLAACTVEPEPLRFGKDGCHACKMTLMDSKFGAEIVT
jgi:copper chaperone NosL